MPIFQRLQLTIFFHIFVATSAFRSSHQNILESTDLTRHHLGWLPLDRNQSQRQGFGSCTTEESVLKAVLVKLGLKTPNLHQPGIMWDGCHVTKIIILSGKDLNGSLSSEIGKLQKLQVLHISDTKVSVNLSSLKEATELQELKLSGTKASGELSSLKGATKMKRLSLEGTAVSGDLASLKEATELRKLWLSGTKVSGELSSLKGATKMQFLRLQRTEVTGDLSSLKEARKLQKIDLLRTFVTGDFSVLLQWPEIEEVDFSGTNINGTLSEDWRGKTKKLLRLRLAGTRVKFILNGAVREVWTERHEEKVLFPKLNLLEVSNCPLNTSLMVFFVPLVACRHLATIKAAGCGLQGHMPNLRTLSGFTVDSSRRFFWRARLDDTLQMLDISNNHISKVQSFPWDVQSVTLANNPVIEFSPGLLESSLNKGISLDLQGSSLVNPGEAEQLIKAGKLTMTESVTSFDKSMGYECKSITHSSLVITPAMFLPDTLCVCAAGWTGSGIKCNKCPVDTYRPSNTSASKCSPCPAHSRAESASVSITGCRCVLGEMYQEGDEWRCGCPQGQAHLGNTCVNCDPLKLSCIHTGSEAHSAPPLEGFARVAPNSTQAFKCFGSHCKSANADRDHLGCAKGYKSTLCSDCMPHYHRDGTKCKPCPRNAPTFPWLGVGVFLVVISIVVTLVALVIWRRASQTDHRNASSFDAVKTLAASQGSVLLQICQLWPIMSGLSTIEREGSGMWEMPYIEVLQLSFQSFKESLTLQCYYDGTVVRWIFAILSPIIPLLVILACLTLEIYDRGMGIGTALKALTLVYIGGASACSELFRCQTVDANGDELPAAFHFRKYLPNLGCETVPDVDAVAYGTAFCYGVVIPTCLLYLYVKQQVQTQQVRTCFAAALFSEKEINISWQKIVEYTDSKTETQRHLVAAATAYVSVLFRGRVRMKISGGNVIVTPVEGQHRTNELNELGEMELTTLMDSKNAQQAAAVRCRAIAKMLTERCILQEARADRVLTGAKNIFAKYALARNIWMEILLKLSAVALVTLIEVVRNEAVVKLCLGVTVGTAAIISLAQPYLQPQINRLQCICFICLSATAVGFAFNQRWLSRAALCLPFVFAAWQLRRPDSPEMLAVRLWEEVDSQLSKLQKGEEIEVMVETFSFL